LGSFTIDNYRYDEYNVEMSNYLNFANVPHRLIVKSRKTSKIVFEQEFETESKAINYISEVRKVGINKENFIVQIVGPNMLYVE
jgi:hypothetical protein